MSCNYCGVSLSDNAVQINDWKFYGFCNAFCFIKANIKGLPSEDLLLKAIYEIENKGGPGAWQKQESLENTLA